ncbi:MAG: M23 family metallopeptidase [Thermodesulfobacteriota bacterium]
MSESSPTGNRKRSGARWNRKKTAAVLAGIIGGVICLAAYTAYTTTAWVNESQRVEKLRAKYRQQESTIAGLHQKIEKRDNQFQRLAGKLYTLENRMDELARLEKNIRNIAGVDEKSEPIADFAIGGAMPDAIDPPESIWKKYENRMQCLSGRVERLNHTATKRSRSLQALYEILKTQQELLAVTPSIRPVDGGWVSSGFGDRKSPFTDQKEFHTGVDIAIRAQSPVKATADGVVKFCGTSGHLGKCVVLDHGYGITSRYGHLEKARVTAEQKVKKGEIIAETGNSGRSTGPHLHYEVRFNGIPINAEKYMATSLAGNATD